MRLSEKVLTLENQSVTVSAVVLDNPVQLLMSLLWFSFYSLEVTCYLNWNTAKQNCPFAHSGSAKSIKIQRHKNPVQVWAAEEKLWAMRVCVCVAAVALPPEKTDSCCVEEKTQERDSQSPAGPQKQLQFEVSVNTEQDVYYFPSGWN